MAYFNRGNINLKLKDYQQAIYDNTKATKLNPNFADAFSNLALARVLSGDKQGAVIDLETAAQLYQKQGRKAQAEITLARIANIKS